MSLDELFEKRKEEIPSEEGKLSMRDVEPKESDKEEVQSAGVKPGYTGSFPTNPTPSEEIIEEVPSKRITTKDKYIKLITAKTGLTKKEIEQKIKDKRDDLKGLISEEGALFVIAKELGVKIVSPNDINKMIPSEEVIEVGKDITVDEIMEEIHESEKAFEEVTISEPPVPTPPKPKIIKKKQTPKEQYPLVPIDIDEKVFIQRAGEPLTLGEAKQKVKAEIDLFNFTIENIVNENDFYTTPNGKRAITKSGVRKIMLALNISTEIVSHSCVRDENNQWVATFIVRAKTMNGRSAECIGICEQNEKNRKRTLHDTLATAQTRASSRAILDLVGFGAVSKEELEDLQEI